MGPLLFAPLVAASICGERIDASSEAAARASIGRITARMTAEQRSRFVYDCDDITSAFRGPDRSPFAGLAGLTVVAIPSRAEQARSEWSRHLEWLRRAADAGGPPRTVAPGAGKPAVVDGVEVEVSEVTVGSVPLDGGGQSSELLSIRVKVTNRTEFRKVEHHTWRGDWRAERGTAGRGSVADNLGNVYRRIDFDFRPRPVGTLDGFCSVYPGKSAEELLPFEVPVGQAKLLVLTLPAKNFGGEGDIELRITAAAIKRAKK